MRRLLATLGIVLVILISFSAVTGENPSAGPLRALCVAPYCGEGR